MRLNYLRSSDCNGCNRNFINNIKLAHFVWDHYNPDNKFRSGFIVHHKDGDSLNDHISNLELVEWGQHSSIHNKGIEKTEEHKRNLSKSRKGHKASEETRNKLSEMRKGDGNSFYGKNHSEETKRKLSEGRQGEKHHMWGKHQSEETKIKRGLYAPRSPETIEKYREARRLWWQNRKESMVNL